MKTSTMPKFILRYRSTTIAVATVSKETLATALQRFYLPSWVLIFCFPWHFSFFPVLPFVRGQLIFMSAVATWWERWITLARCIWHDESAVHSAGMLGSSLEILDRDFNRNTSFAQSDKRDLTGYREEMGGRGIVTIGNVKHVPTTVVELYSHGITVSSKK